MTEVILLVDSKQKVSWSKKEFSHLRPVEEHQGSFVAGLRSEVICLLLQYVNFCSCSCQRSLCRSYELCISNREFVHFFTVSRVNKASKQLAV